MNGARFFYLNISKRTLMRGRRTRGSILSTGLGHTRTTVPLVDAVCAGSRAAYCQPAIAAPEDRFCVGKRYLLKQIPFSIFLILATARFQLVHL
jgi:hypothetical protein